MKQRPFGFGQQREREKNEIEEELGFYLVDKNADPYLKERGKIVELCLSSGNFLIGCYQGLFENGNYILKPCIVTEITPKSEIETNVVRRTQVWIDEPIYIRSDLIVGLSPVRKEYFEEIKRRNTLEKEAMQRDSKAKQPEYHI